MNYNDITRCCFANVRFRSPETWQRNGKGCLHLTASSLHRNGQPKEDTLDKVQRPKSP